MEIVCLDLEGVLIPEIWIAFAEETKIDILKKTTREEPDYTKLMYWRMDVLREHKLTLKDIQNTIAKIKPLDGAREFLDELRAMTQVVILSDTFTEFAKPLMAQLGYPTIFCNNLIMDKDGYICGMNMRKEDGKRIAIEHFKDLNFRTFATGDSYNDLTMINTADCGCLFNAPDNITSQLPNVKSFKTYSELLGFIKKFIGK